MTGCVLDASALVAFVFDEPAADEVRELLLGPAMMSAVNAAEFVQTVIRRTSVDADEVVARLADFRAAGLRIVACEVQPALRAGVIRSRHYHRTRSQLSLADCVALATALTSGLSLATSDQALCTVAAADGCEVIPLPNSAGRRPKVTRRG